jgi:hypothetical protein
VENVSNFNILAAKIHYGNGFTKKTPVLAGHYGVRNLTPFEWVITSVKEDDDLILRARSLAPPVLKNKVFPLSPPFVSARERRNFKLNFSET